MQDKTNPGTGDTQMPERAYGEIVFSRINKVGLSTLIYKEIHRFMKVKLQTVFSPVVSSILFLAIFVGSIGPRWPVTSGGEAFSFAIFVLPGLTMLGLVNNAFTNTSSSIIIGKMQGSLTDVLGAPLSNGELLTGFIIGGMVRGFLVGVVSFFSVLLFIFPTANEMNLHVFSLLFFSLSGALLFSTLGFLAGLWSERFDHLSAVTNFIVTPLSMLSGTFFPITRLPELAQTISLFNPIFLLMDGFRYGVLGASELAPMNAALALVGMNILLLRLAYLLLKRGWRIKA